MSPIVYFIDDSATMREVIKIAFRRECLGYAQQHLPVAHGASPERAASSGQHDASIGCHSASVYATAFRCTTSSTGHLGHSPDQCSAGHGYADTTVAGTFISVSGG